MKTLAPSIMCADPLHFGRELARLKEAGVTLLHCDIMDGVFVNNMALPPYIIEAIQKTTDMQLDVHLVTMTPEKYIAMLAPLCPAYISFHIETTDHPKVLIDQIHHCGSKASIAVSPTTPLVQVEPFLDDVEMVLMMTVTPGFAGQAFQYPVLNKLKELQTMLQGRQRKPLIEVDGNIHAETIKLTRELGADIFVVGTAALFNDTPGSYREKLAPLRVLIGEH